MYLNSSISTRNGPEYRLSFYYTSSVIAQFPVSTHNILVKITKGYRFWEFFDQSKLRKVFGSVQNL